MEDATWPYDKSELWSIYQQGAQFPAIDTIRILTSKIPKNGRIDLRFRPIRAIPVQPVSIRKPALVCDGRRMVFDTSLESGSFLEYSPEDNICRIFDRSGAQTGEAESTGDPIILEHGANHVKIELGSGEFPLRTHVTLRMEGDPEPI